MSERKENDVQEAVEELLTDPDAPEQGNSTPPPQTTDAEPSDDR
ncbi:hypothetical protein [uncultured Sphingomonas sp.]